MKKLNPNVKLT